LFEKFKLVADYYVWVPFFWSVASQLSVHTVIELERPFDWDSRLNSLEKDSCSLFIQYAQKFHRSVRFTFDYKHHNVNFFKLLSQNLPSFR
jgi:hypothetical protein